MSLRMGVLIEHGEKYSMNNEMRMQCAIIAR